MIHLIFYLAIFKLKEIFWKISPFSFGGFKDKNEYLNLSSGF